MTLASIDEALSWLREHWEDGRHVPLTINDHETDGELGGLRYSAPFQQYLTARMDDEQTVDRVIDCAHESARGVARNCRVCEGQGYYVKRGERIYRYPMWRALRLIKERKPIRDWHPSPGKCIAAIVHSGWDWRAAAAYIGATDENRGLAPEVFEALALMALRDLWGLCQQTPATKPERKSDAQLDAEAGDAA